MFYFYTLLLSFEQAPITKILLFLLINILALTTSSSNTLNLYIYIIVCPLYIFVSYKLPPQNSCMSTIARAALELVYTMLFVYHCE